MKLSGEALAGKQGSGIDYDVVLEICKNIKTAVQSLGVQMGIVVGGGADGWAVLADLVFYIFFAPQLAFMMERLMYAVNAQMEAAEAVNKLEAILKESPCQR